MDGRMWTPRAGTWTHSALPYEIERHAELADLMPGGVRERFEVRRGGELLAVRFSLARAVRYAEERWEFLDGRH